MIKKIAQTFFSFFQSKDSSYVKYKILNDEEIHKKYISTENACNELRKKIGFPSGLQFLYGDSRYIAAEYNPNLIKETEIKKLLENFIFKIEKIKGRPLTKIFGLEFHF